LKLQHAEPLSSIAFNLNLHRYMKGITATFRMTNKPLPVGASTRPLVAWTSPASVTATTQVSPKSAHLKPKSGRM
jgi:hypothetical protein